MLQCRKSFGEVVEDLISDNDASMSQVWERYVAIKNAELEVQKRVGPAIIMDRVYAITHKKPLPLEDYFCDDWDESGLLPKQAVTEALKNYLSPDKEALQQVLMEHTQESLHLLRKKGGRVTQAEDFALSVATKTVLPGEALKKYHIDPTKANLTRLDRLELLLYSMTAENYLSFLGKIGEDGMNFRGLVTPRGATL
jgi:hypothetical protein